MTFRDGIPEACAIEAASAATRLEPFEFVQSVLSILAESTPWKHLAYSALTVRHGFHFRITVNIPNDPVDFPNQPWEPSKFDGAIYRSLGEPIILSDLKEDWPHAGSANEPSWSTKTNLRPAAIVASEGVLPGIMDALTVFEKQNTETPISTEEKERVWQLFTAVRLGLKISIDSQVKSQSLRIVNKAFVLVDRFGYFLTADPIQTDLVQSHLRSENPALLIDGNRFAIDAVASDLEKHGVAYINGMEIRQNGCLFSLAISRNAMLARMSPRERQIAELIAAGKSYKSIAANLGIALSTVSNISVRIRAKLGLSRKEEIAVLLNHG